jgi:hypothetical protein
MELGQSAQIQVVGIEARGRVTDRPLDLGEAQLGLDSTNDTAGDLVLELEDVVERPIKPVGPNVSAAGRVDQLTGDANPGAGFRLRPEIVVPRRRLNSEMGQHLRQCSVARRATVGTISRILWFPECSAAG